MPTTPNRNADDKQPEGAGAPDPVEEASLASFPASDPPAWTGVTGHKGTPVGPKPVDPSNAGPTPDTIAGGRP